MEEEKTSADKLLENIYDKSLKEYSEFIKMSFKDLVILTKDDKEVFLDLYYNRDTEFIEMKSILRNIRNRGDNILILGQAGSGKSSFMYKVFYEIEGLEEYKLYPIIADFWISMDKNFLLINFIGSLIKYFEKMDCPCNKTKDNIYDNIYDNIHLLKSHLANLTEKDLSKHLIIFLDDFDYIEKEFLFDVLEIFMGFGIHQNATLVLSARPHLYASIKEYDNRIAKNFIRDVHRIDLTRLDIKKLITRRLAIILIENEKKLSPTKWWERITGQESPYLKLLNKMGIDNIKDLRKISIPFTDLYINFIRCITDNNIRETFDMVHDSLIYILANYNKLETVKEKDDFEMVDKKEIPREVALQLFFDNENSKYKIINLHKDRSQKTKNSLFFNMLEAIKVFREINESLYSAMSRLGHNKKDVDWAIEKLKDPSLALITPSKVIPRSVKSRVDRYPEYKITKKGDYYLTNLSYWEEYINRCGTYGQSLNEILSS